MKKQLLSKDVPARPSTPGPDELPRVARVPVSGLLKKSSASVGERPIAAREHTVWVSSDDDESTEEDYDYPLSDGEDDSDNEPSDDEAQGYVSE